MNPQEEEILPEKFSGLQKLLSGLYIYNGIYYVLYTQLDLLFRHKDFVRFI